MNYKPLHEPNIYINRSDYMRGFSSISEFVSLLLVLRKHVFWKNGSMSAKLGLTQRIKLIIWNKCNTTLFSKML